MEIARKKRTTSKADHHSDSRDKLMDAGYKLICKNGIDGVGVREISAAAGVSTGTFYYFFKDKLDLLSCYTFEKNNFEKGEDVLKDGSVYDRIIDFFTKVVVKILKSDGYDVAMWVLMKKETSPKLYDALYKLVEEGIDSKEFSDEKTSEELTHFLLDAYRGAAFAWYRSNGTIDLCTLIHEHVGYSLEHFLNK